MEMPDYYKTLLEINLFEDLIENVYLKSLIDAYPTVIKTKDISLFSENEIRNKFQYIIQFYSGKLSEWINNRIITLCVENQIITLAEEIKRTDIEFNISRFKYIVECKKVKGVDKRQYIDDGIARFVNHIYINENDKFAAMCSFVVDGALDTMIPEIKKRVSACKCLGISDKQIVGFDCFISTHTKIDNQPILIHHLFFCIKNK